MAQDKGMNPVAAGVVGAAVGVAAGVAAVELSNEKNREALGEKLEDIKEEGVKVYSEIKDKVEEKKADD